MLSNKTRAALALHAALLATPAWAQPTPDTPAPAASPTPQSKGNTASINLFGIGIELKAMEAGIAMGPNGRTQYMAEPELTFDTGEPLLDLALKDASERFLHIGDRLYNTHFSNMNLDARFGKVAVQFRSQIDVTRFKTPSDKNFGPNQSFGFIVKDDARFRLLAGTDTNEEALAVMASDRLSGDKFDINAAAGVTLSDGPYARAMANYRITNELNAAAFVHSKEGAGARVSYVTNVSSGFRLAAQGSYTTQHGASAGVEGEIALDRSRTLTAGADTSQGGRVYASIKTRFGTKPR